MPRITADDLHNLVASTLLAAGADGRNADRVADAVCAALDGSLTGTDATPADAVPSTQ